MKTNLKEKRDQFVKGLAYCKDCEEYLTIDNFHKSTRGIFGIRNYCSKCRNERDRLSTIKHRAKRDAKGNNCGVYSITDTTNNKIVYIGHSSDIRRRRRSHFCVYKQTGKVFLNTPLSKDEQSKYKLELVKEIKSLDARLLVERVLIKIHKPEYNLA